MRKILLTIGVLASTTAFSAPIGDYTFKSPAFNGSGYSSHVLTIENQEFTRQKALRDQLQSAIDKASADAANTNMSKFLSNLESRVYAQISQNLAAAMFKTNADGSTPMSGMFVMSKNIDGSPMTWMEWKKADDGNNITITVYQPGQAPTSITVPMYQWTF